MTTPEGAKKSKVLQNTIESLNELQAIVVRDTVEPILLSSKISRFVDRLGELNVEGKAMDDLSLFRVPAQLVGQLDSVEESNLDIYEFKLIGDTVNCAESLKMKGKYFQDIKTRVSNHIHNSSTS